MALLVIESFIMALTSPSLFDLTQEFREKKGGLRALISSKSRGLGLRARIDDVIWKNVRNDKIEIYNYSFQDINMLFRGRLCHL